MSPVYHISFPQVSEETSLLEHHHIEIGPPDPIHDCTQGEPDPFMVTIHCTPGYDGGLPQSFIAEFYTSTEYTFLQSTVENTVPSFTVYNLPPGTRYCGQHYNQFNVNTCYFQILPQDFCGKCKRKKSAFEDESKHRERNFKTAAPST